MDTASKSRRNVMRFDMHAQGFPLSEALRAYAERRMQYALRPDSARVRRVAL